METLSMSATRDLTRPIFHNVLSISDFWLFSVLAPNDLPFADFVDLSNTAVR